MIITAGKEQGARSPGPGTAWSRASADGTADERVPAAIIGGGISGLALARWLREEGIRAIVFDRAATPGGVIGTVTQDGFTFESGPNTILDKSPAFNNLLDLTGLSDEAVRVPMSSQERYVWHAGKLRAVPTGPGGLLLSDLFSLRGKLRLLRETRVPRSDKDEPLETFVRRRLGDEIYERAFLPMVQGIGAGDPARMSTEASFPLLKELEREHGSLLRGFIRKMKAARAERGGAPRPPVHIVSFPAGTPDEPGGLARLALRLAVSLGADWRAESPVAGIHRRPSGDYELSVGKPGDEARIIADQVVLCTPADEAARLLEPFDPSLAADVGAVRYCPMAAVGLGVPRDSITLPPGFGFLAARGQGVDMLGAIFNSSFLPDRAPDGFVALTAMLGGELRPGDVDLPDEGIMEILKRDLGRVLGWNGAHRVARVVRWPRAIPQYAPGHTALVARMKEFERSTPGFHLFGNWRAGVSINDRIDMARTLARSMAASRAGTGSDRG